MDVANEIFELTKTYFQMMDEDLSDDFIKLLVASLIDEYKTRRAYPSTYTAEMIQKDVDRYFSLRKSNVAMKLIPEEYGRIGAEGLSMLTDNTVTRMWKNSVILNDVVPICEVV